MPGSILRKAMPPNRPVSTDSRVVEVDGIDAAGAKRLRKVHEDGAGVALYWSVVDPRRILST